LRIYLFLQPLTDNVGQFKSALFLAAECFIFVEMKSLCVQLKDTFIKNKDMVRAINRIIGSEVDQRILSTFNYGSPTPNREGRSQWIGKPQRKLSEVKKRWNKTKSLPKSFI
jgi:hypothetical protein